MSRKQFDFGARLEAEIAARGARGESAKTIAAAIGMPEKERTIARRLEDIRPAPPPAAASTPEDAEVPDAVPEGTPVEMIDKWIRRVEKGAAAAEAQGNLAALSSLAMRAASLAEARRKAMPIPKADPNENPDMRALAGDVEKRFLKLVDELFATAPAP